MLKVNTARGARQRACSGVGTSRTSKAGNGGWGGKTGRKRAKKGRLEGNGETGRGQAGSGLEKKSPGGSPGVGRRRGREPRPRPGEARAPGRPPYQREQEAPEQGGRGREQRPLRPHRIAGRSAARRFSAGTGSGSRRGTASVAGSDGRGRGGEARAAAAVGAAAVAPTSSSGSAQRTRKPPRGARGGQVGARRQSGCCSVLCGPGAGRRRAVGLGVSCSFQLPDPNSPESPDGVGAPPRATFSIPSSS